MKKFVSLLMTVVLLATMLTVFAVPASAESQTIPGTDITWELTENGTVLPNGDTGLSLTISGEGAMPNYDNSTYEDRPWHSAAETVTTVQVGSGITTLGDYAFYHFEKLTSVTIPSSVQSIGIDAFEGCTSLTSVTIPSEVQAIGISAFGGCTSLTSVTIPYGITSIGDSTFSNCANLTSVTIPYGITSIGLSAFCRCGFTSINIPSSVQSIGNSAFQGCTNLESFTIPSGVEFVGIDVFGTCSNLTSITFKTNTPPTWQNFGELATNKKLTFYVPAGTSNDYKSIGGWAIALKQNRVKDAYVVDDQPGKNGTILLDKDWFPADDFAEGQTVTVTVVPAAGCQFKEGSLSVMTADGKAIASTQDETDPTKFRFEMPAAKVIVKAEFEECEHTESEWVTETEATCVIDGKRVNKCKACGKVLETEVIPATGKHTFDTSKWHYDATYHWHAAVCCDTEEVLDKKEHTYNFFGFGNTCTVCGYVKGGSVTGSTLSDGSWWIIGGIAVIAVVGVAALIIVKKKKKPALASGENTDEE